MCLCVLFGNTNKVKRLENDRVWVFSGFGYESHTLLQKSDSLFLAIIFNFFLFGCFFFFTFSQLVVNFGNIEICCTCLS